MNKKFLINICALAMFVVAGCGSKTSTSVVSSSKKTTSSSTVAQSSQSEVTLSSSSDTKESSTVTSSSEKESSTVTSSSEKESSTVISSETNDSSIIDSSIVTSSSSEDTNVKQMFIKGSFNGWTNEALTYVGNYTYEYENLLASVPNTEFGFVDEVESWYGDPDKNFSNFVISEVGVYKVTFTFIERGYKVELTKTGDAELSYPTDWYVLGTISSWSASDDYKLAAVEGEDYKYSITLELPASAEFKVATSDWSSDFGYWKVAENEVKANFTSGANGNIVVTNANTYTLTIDLVADVLTISL